MDAQKEMNLLALNVNEHTDKKNGLTYLSWAWAASEMLKAYPDMTYTVERDEEGRMYKGDPSVGYMVNTAVTAGGITREMWLPVMDYKNKAILKPTMTDINKAIMRCLTKNFAMFGLGLYIYAGEDLPEEDTKQDPKQGVDTSKINMPVEEEYDPATEMMTEKDQMVLEGLFQKAGLDPAEQCQKWKMNWPHLNKGQYDKVARALHKHLGDE